MPTNNRAGRPSWSIEMESVFRVFCSDNHFGQGAIEVLRESINRTPAFYRLTTEQMFLVLRGRAKYAEHQFQRRRGRQAWWQLLAAWDQFSHADKLLAIVKELATHEHAICVSLARGEQADPRARELIIRALDAEEHLTVDELEAHATKLRLTSR